MPALGFETPSTASTVDLEKTADVVYPTMGAGKPFPSDLPKASEYLVEFNEHDPWNPQNWSPAKKHSSAVIVCLGTLIAALDSAMFAPGAANASTEFSVSREVGILGTSLYVLGFACGPPLWAPCSELFGRRWPIRIGMLGCAIFTLGAATAKDIQTLIICRFFGGVFGASPFCVVPGVLADIYTNAHRGVAILFYALTVFCGPFAAPFISGYIATSYLGWRWTLYLPSILAFASTFLLFFLDESYHPMVLASKAVQLRRQTGNWGIHAAHEKIELDVGEVASKYFTRPVRMIFTEPIILAVSLYMSFIYGLVYALLVAYPFVFGEVYGMNLGERGLPFLGLILGIVLGVVFVLTQNGSYIRKLQANDYKPIPEWRLVPPMIGAPAFTAGLFWFAWTSYTPSVHWIVPSISGVLTGFGLLCIFLPCFNYLVDAYLPIAASAVASNIMMRSTIAAAFPLFSRQMFQNLGIQYAGTLLGCLAAIMIPIPFVLRMYGPSLRSKSKELAR